MKLGAVIGVFWLMSAFVGTAAPLAGTSVESPPRPPIREFDIETLSRLGREIYQHDQLAWVATDVLLAKVKVEQLRKEGATGWIVDVSSFTVPTVRFLCKMGGSVEAAYDVSFPKGKPPVLSVPEQRSLTHFQQARAQSLATATKAVFDGSHPWCGGNPNTVVLDDPDGSGFLVYFLRAKPAADAVPMGGHYRISVSADGSSVEQIDRLSASCLTMNKQGDMPSGAAPVALTVSHIVSATPVETHVFLSLQEKLPFFVVTKDSRVWQVEKGQIVLSDMKITAAEPANISGK